MVTLTICALLIAGVALFVVAAFRFLWYGALMLWRGFLHTTATVVNLITRRDIP